MIDVVVPAHPKDFDVLRLSVRSALRHLVPVRRVVVVSPERFSYDDARVEWVPEPSLPALPALSDLRLRRPELETRAAWIYQQLLKLGAAAYVPGLTDRFLAMDADVVFLRRVEFGPALPRFPYSRATELHPPYLETYARLTGEPAQQGHSFVAHHMLFDQDFLGDLLSTIAERHGMPWYWAVVDAADPLQGSSLGEWDLYGQWVLSRHPDQAVHRQVFWKDARTVPGPWARALLGLDFDFVAAHNYAREGRLVRAWHVGKRLAAELAAR